MDLHLASHRGLLCPAIRRSRAALGGLALLLLGISPLASAASAAPAPAPDARSKAARAEALERSSRFTPPAPRMQPVLSASAVARIAAEGRTALWVVFTDKAVFDERSFGAAVRDAGARLTERARARRAKEQGGQYAPDFDDVPVPARYVEAVAATGAGVRHVSKWMNAVSVMANDGEARRIATLPFVRAILPLQYSRPITPVSEGPAIEGAPSTDEHGAAPAPGAARASALNKPPSTGYGPSITQLTSINVPAVHDSGYSGASVILAMFDTGFNKSHTATIQLKRIAEWDFVWEDSETANQIPPDASGQWDHGTGTWAVAGGYWINNLIGPAYNATFALAKTEYVPTETHAEEDNWAAAAEWADSLGVDVISSSLAYLDFDPGQTDYTWNDLNGHTTIVAQAAILAARRGIVVANAMGNSGPGGRTLDSPADADSILSCGAVDTNNGIASFSSRGNTSDGRIKPEVVAQGVGTYWAVASNNVAIAQANGTSLSTPLVAGSAALVREAHPEWTVAQVRQALMTTADRANIPDSIYGWGRINVQAAIWSSSLGAPVFPRPFNLLLPSNNTTVTTTPLTLRWRSTTDPQNEALTYTVTLRNLTTNQVVFSKTTTDSSAQVANYLGPSTTYEWSVVATDALSHGRSAREPFRFTTGATTDVAIPPSAAGVVLGQNRPNPFLRATDIPFTLAGSGAPVAADLRVFDARGRLVKTLVDSDQATARQYLIRWDGRDEAGRPAAAGIYFYRLRAAGRELVRRLVLVR
ncbi:MAG TPA: S8 family serine peptidase [Candidatus Binatia bacterium]|nr:S8 family serine peptidase [Candidatus Binatia bacterium]